MQTFYKDRLRIHCVIHTDDEKVDGFLKDNVY